VTAVVVGEMVGAAQVQRWGCRK